MGWRVTGVRVTPISGILASSECVGGATSAGASATASVGVGLSVVLGGTVATMGGVVARAGADDTVVVGTVVDSMMLAGSPPLLRDTNSTVDTRLATTPTPSVSPRSCNRWSYSPGGWATDMKGWYGSGRSSAFASRVRS